MGYRHWNAADSLTDLILQLDKFSDLKPNRTESERTNPARRLTLVPTRRLLSDHIAAGTSPDMPEQKTSMVPYQEVRSTSQTLWEPRRMFSQVAMRRPPEPPDLIGGEILDSDAAAAVASNRTEPPLTGIRIIKMIQI